MPVCGVAWVLDGLWNALTVLNWFAVGCLREHACLCLHVGVGWVGCCLGLLFENCIVGASIFVAKF